MLLLLRQSEPAEQSRRRQETMLRRLVSYSYSQVDYYRSLFDAAGVSPDDILTVRDLAKLPVTTRKDLQSVPLAQVTARSRDLSRSIKTRTSGTTGVPLEIITNRADRAMMSASFASVYVAWGIKPWDRLCFIQARKELLEGKSWYEHLGILRRKNLSVWDRTGEWIRQIERWRPRLLQGYSLTLKLFAEAVRESTLPPPRIPFVVSTSGVLDPGGRALIEQTFSARVIDVYASEEAGGVIAWQCPLCPGYHLNTQNLIVEFLKDGRPASAGELGSVIITNLSNYTMPFVRYDQGDVVVPSGRSPSCGRTAPLLNEIQGRSSDVIVLPSGARLTSHPFFMVLDNILGIAEWRLIQPSSAALRVEACLSQYRNRECGGPDLPPPVPGVSPEPGRVCQEVVAALRPLVGPEVRIEVCLVDRIRRDPSRKLRSVVSEIGG